MDFSIEDQISYAWSSYRAVRNVFSTEHIHIARYIRPEISEFFEETNQNNRPAIELLWDDTAIKANDLFARSIWSLAHNSATNWFSYKDKSAAVMNDGSASDWYRMVNDDLRDALKASNVYGAMLSRLKDVGAFGYGAIYTYEDEKNPAKINVEYVRASECFFTRGADGLADSFIRPLNLTAREAIEIRKWPEEKLPQPLVDAYKRKDVQTKFLFLHVVWERFPKPQGRPRSNLDYEWAGYHFCPANKTIVNEHGFKRFPYHVLSWDGASNEPYSFGIGYHTLPEIRNINATRRDYDRLIRNEADSPMLTPAQTEKPGGEQWRPQPGELIVGGMSGDGKRLYEPYYTGNGSRVLLEEIKESRQIIQEAWYNSLLMMQTQRQMTAEEVRSRDAKLVQAMAPFMIVLAPDAQTIIERFFYARLEAGVYDPLPSIFDKDTKMDLRFSGLLAKAQEVLEGEQIIQLMAEAQVIAQLDAEAVLLGTDFNAAYRRLAESKAIPTDIVLSKEEYQKRKKENEQTKQAQTAAAMAPDLAKAARDGAAAMKDMNANGQPNSPMAQ